MRTAQATPGSSEAAHDRLLQRWLLALLAVGVLWRLVRYLLQFPVWGDESFVCLNLADHTFMGLTGPLRWGQVVPILFLWGELAALKALGSSALALRLLPLLAGLGGLLLTWRLARLTLAPLPRALAVAFLAVAIWPVSMATLIKPYSLDLFMSCALLVPAVEWLQRPERWWWLVVLVVIIPTAVFASFPVVFVAGAVSVALLPGVWRRGWKPKLLFALFNVLLVASFCASYLITKHNQLDHGTAGVEDFLHSYWADGFPPHGTWPFLKWFVLINTGQLFAYPVGGSNGLSAVTTILSAIGAWQLWQKQQRALLAMCLMPFVLGLAAALLDRYPYGAACRLSQHVAPIICLLAGLGAAALLERISSLQLQRRWIIGVCCLFAALGLGGTVRDVIWPYRGETDVWLRQLARSILAQCGPNDQIVLLNPEASTNVVLNWELTRYQLRGGYLGWEGQLDSRRLQGQTGQVWALDLACWKMGHALPPLELAPLKRVRDGLAQSQRTWLLAEEVPCTHTPARNKDPRFRCEVYHWVSPNSHAQRKTLTEIPHGE